MTSLAQWHAALNERTAVEEHRRATQFGLRTDVGRLTPARRCAPTVWAWQDGEHPSARSSVAKVGFSAARPHLGHLGLARDTAAHLDRGGGLLLYADNHHQLAGGQTAAARFRSLVTAFRAEDGHRDIGITDPAGHADFQAIAHQATDDLILRRGRQLYGWDDSTPLRKLRDVTTMLGFFLHRVDPDRPHLALVDINQAPHTALLRMAAKRVGQQVPTVLYRRLTPSLRGAGQRMTGADLRSTIFLDDDDATTRRRFMKAATGGRPTAELQRQHGGDPTRCPTFEVIELLAAPNSATNALRACVSGARLCADCKDAHVDEVVTRLSTLRSHADDAPLRRVPGPRAGCDRAASSPSVAPALADAAPTLHRPPARRPDALERRIAAYAGVDPSQVVVGTGSTELIDLALAESGSHEVATTTPTFDLYADLAHRNGLALATISWNPDSGRHDLTAITRRVSANTACVVDVPHSVTGTALDTDEDWLAALADRRAGSGWLVVDNVYHEYMTRPLPVTGELLETYPQLVVARTLSKAFCLLGARVGYVLTSAAHAARLRARWLPYSVSSLAHAAAAAALDDPAALDRNVAVNADARDFASGAVRAAGLTHLEADANFMLVRLGAHHSRVTKALQFAGLRYRDGSRWGLPDTIQFHLVDRPTVTPIIEAVVGNVVDQPESARPARRDLAKGTPR